MSGTTTTTTTTTWVHSDGGPTYTKRSYGWQSTERDVTPGAARFIDGVLRSADVVTRLGFFKRACDVEWRTEREVADCHAASKKSHDEAMARYGKTYGYEWRTVTVKTRVGPAQKKKRKKATR